MENRKDSPLLHIKREFHPLNFNYSVPSPEAVLVTAAAAAGALRS